VANYEVNLEVALRGAEKIKKLRSETNLLSKEINKFNRAVDKKMGRKKKEGSFVQSFNNLSREVSNAKSQLNKAAIGTDQFNKAVENVVKVEEKYNKELKKRDRALRVQRVAQKQGISLAKAELVVERELAKAKDATARKQRGKRFGQTISSAAIGGAFPLLFGQTGAAAVGGGLGGLAGGAIGGQFGFALSIVGTALGSAIDKNDKFNQSLAALNVRFSDVSGGAQLTAKDIDAVAKRLRITKEEAFGVLGAFAQFGSGSIAKSLTEIFGADAGAFDSIANANRQAELANQIFEARTKIGNQVATQLLNQNLITDSATIELALAEARAKAENDIAVARAKQITFSDRFRDFGEELLFRGGGDPSRYGEGRANKLQKEFEEGRNKRMKDFKDALEEVRIMLGLVKEANNEFGQSGELAFSAINDKVKDLQDEMLRLQNPIFQVITLSQSMAQSFESSFEGIIRGTMSINDAFRNMFNAIVDHFIKSAARMAANQFQQGLLSLFTNIFTPNPYNVKPGQSLYDVATPSRFTTTFDPSMQRANGGPVMKGGSYLVGERGPEMFSPGVSGTITPNEMLGGSTNIVVNVDASGSSVEGDEEQGRELGRLISVAVQSELIQQKRPGGILA
jgi:hypothetical protein